MIENAADQRCVLLADDDLDDRTLTQRALKKSRLVNRGIWWTMERS